MKYWHKRLPIIGDGQPKITLNGGSDRLLSIKKEDNEIRFREECDSYFCLYVSKEQAIEILQEAIDWIKEV